jgi:hypothetical protein
LLLKAFESDQILIYFEMKKKALQLTIAILLSIVSNLYAQKITLGAKGGFSIPNLTGGSADNPLNSGYSSRLGADGGVYGEYHLNEKFSISVGLEYSSQGGLKDKFQAYPTPPAMAPLFAPAPAPTYLYANFKSEAKLDYLLIPVVAKYRWKLDNKNHLTFYAAAGPFAGFLLSAHQVTNGSSLIYMDEQKTMPLPVPAQSFDANTSIKSDLYTFNTGIDGFAGFLYNLTPKHALFIEGGGNLGIITIQKGSANGKNYAGAGVVTFGYAYTIKN